MINTLCDFTGGCATRATRWGLLAVSEGVTAHVATCELHSYRWSSLWGSWPLDSVDVDKAHTDALVMARRLATRQRRSPNLTMTGMLATHSGLRCNVCFGYGNGLCASHAHMEWSVISRLTEPLWGAELHGPWNPGVTVCPSAGNGCTHTSVMDDTGAVVACA